MNYIFQIQKLLLKNEEQISPDDKLSHLKQAIAIADTNNDIDWGFELRIDLMREESNTSRCIESFPALSWLLDTYDQNPKKFDQIDFMYEYNWMLSSVRYNSHISLEQTEHIFNDYKARLLDCGYNLRSYHTALLLLYSMMGKFDQAFEQLALRESCPVDSFPVYPHFETYTAFAIHIRKGNFDEAFRIALPILEQDVVGVMPFVTCCTAVFYLSLNNDYERAAYYCKKALQIIPPGNSGSKLTDVADLIFFLAKTDPPKAWELFEGYISSNINTEEYLDYILAIRVLPLLSTKGVRQLKVTPKLEWYRSDDTYQIEDIYQFYLNKAQELANQFDARNQTDYLNQQLKVVLEKL